MSALPPEKQRLRFRDLRQHLREFAIAARVHPKRITLDHYSHLFFSVEEASGRALDAIYAAGEATEWAQ